MEIDSKIIIIDVIFLILLSIMHFTFSFFIRASDFNNLFDTFESSPLYDFEVNNNCGLKDYIIFHTWEGYKKTEYYYERGRSHSRTEIVDKTDITKINRFKFCYKNKESYKELLYNGQIIKKEESCKTGFKDCGTIDTLEQKLCIRDDDQCPLYDVRLGSIDNSLSSKYNTESNSDIYFNNANYEDMPNKKIIGKLILNDGQPCYNAQEKLWRKFNSDEAGDEHLKCGLEIFGKYNDNRFEELGKISYKKIYDDNLITYESRQLFSSINQNIKVSLYKREFLGIDKECDSKSDSKREDYDKLEKSQKMEKNVLLVEGIIAFVCFFEGICVSAKNGCLMCSFIFNIFIIFLTFIACMICSSVNLVRMMYYSISYDCSDSITNEVFRKENQNTKIQILFTAINLGFDVFFIFIHILGIFFYKCYDKIKCIFKCECCNDCNCYCSCNCCSSCFKKKYEYNNNPKIDYNNYNNNKYNNDNIKENKKYEDFGNLGAPEGPTNNTPANNYETNKNNNIYSDNNNPIKTDSVQVKVFQKKYPSLDSNL